MKGKQWLEDRGIMAKVKKRVLALSRRTNQAMSHVVLRIKSLVEVTWSHGLNSHVLKWFKSHAQGMFAQREETKLIATPYEVIWEKMAYEDIEDSSGWNGYILLILSIGMPYYQGGCNTNHRQVSSAQTNQTHVLTWEKNLSQHLNFLILRLVVGWAWYPSKQAFRKVQDH